MIPRAFWQFFAAFYFAVQTVGAISWCLVVWFEPPMRAWFQPLPTSRPALLAFWVADALVFLGAGAWSAWALGRNPAHARLPLALHLGASWGAALACLGQTCSGEAWNAAILTTCASCGTWLGWKAVGRG